MERWRILVLATFVVAAAAAATARSAPQSEVAAAGVPEWSGEQAAYARQGGAADRDRGR